MEDPLFIIIYTIPAQALHQQAVGALLQRVAMALQEGPRCRVVPIMLLLTVREMFIREVAHNNGNNDNKISGDQ